LDLNKNEFYLDLFQVVIAFRERRR